MNDSKFFIVGANGQLGTALRKNYPNARYADVSELDITDKESVEAYNWSGIDVIFNAAAYTDVDGAETSEGRVAAWAINADAVANLVAVTAQHDATLIHVSSDYVFDGTLTPHDEGEPFSPLSVYGASKAAGDIAASLAPKFYLLRTTWVVGEGKNFVRTMLDLAKNDVSPSVVADQVGRLTFTSEIVRIIDHLLSTKAPFGTYNATNSGKLASWAEITRDIFKIGGYENLSVANTTTADYFAGKEGVALRPLGSDMSLDKLHATGFESRDWEDDLKAFIEKETDTLT